MPRHRNRITLLPKDQRRWLQSTVRISLNWAGNSGGQASLHLFEAYQNNLSLQEQHDVDEAVVIEVCELIEFLNEERQSYIPNAAFLADFP
jgi:hypothetical protein